MFSPKVILWGGLAGAFAGLFWLMTGLAPGSGPSIQLALVLGLGGLTGLYSQQARQGGKLGFAGFALGVIGTVAALAALWRVSARGTQSFLVSSLALLTLGIGLALLGVASLRGKTLPRWRGLSLTLGLLYMLLSLSFWLIFYMPLSQGQNPFDPWTPRAYLPVFTLLVLVGIGWMGLGITLLAAGDAQIPVAKPPPDSAKVR